MKQGFILIEVLLAAVIAAMIGAALFTSLYQITRFTTVVDNYADVWTKASIAHRQMEKDLLGVFIPVAAEKAPEKKKEEGAKNDKEKKEQEAPQPKKEPIKLVNHVFYGVNKESVLDTLTFITDNPMQVYWGARAGKAKPRIARVVYRLIKDKNEKNSYTLMRQEGYDLYFDAYKEASSKDMRQYPMIEGIKQMAVSYGVVEKEDQSDQKEDKAKEKKPQKIKYKVLKEWKKEDKGDQKKEEGKESKKKEIELPAFVLIKLTLWDQQKKRDVYFEFKIPLIAQGKPAPAPIEPPAAMAMPKPPQTQPAGTPSTPPAPTAPGFPGSFMFSTLPARVGARPFTNLETGRTEFASASPSPNPLPAGEVIHAS